MPDKYEINAFEKEESWRLFRYLGELVEGFDKLSGIEPAITIYGSAVATADMADYQNAKQIAYLLGKQGFNIITGGGPGLMEAANLGASEAGVQSVGLNIVLPKEQKGNVYSNLNITFNHFFVRKVMLVKYATAFVIMPGGLGTMDELTEVLTLIQTNKIKPFPVILFNSSFWHNFLDWLQNTVLLNGYISEADLQLLRISDQPEDVQSIVSSWYLKQAITGRRAID
ncbi:MAG: TIGR00730 family Rossman fold protein [Dehalococcoidia bacterium]|nr:TIGR00730 family Rossman fold protein [Dehalococcoidia bacterium]